MRIDGHLRAEHGLSVEAYRAQFFGAEVQADALREARAEQARQTHQGAPRKGQTRTVPCSSCGIPRTVGLTFAPSTHETRCPDCVEAERPKAVPTIRSSPLKGRTLPPETKAKMAANAGRWNAGLTKDTDDRVAAQAEKMAGRTSWSKGLTKADHPKPSGDIREALAVVRRATVLVERPTGGPLGRGLHPLPRRNRRVRKSRRDLQVATSLLAETPSKEKMAWRRKGISLQHGHKRRAVQYPQLLIDQR